MRALTTLLVAAAASAAGCGPIEEDSMPMPSAIRPLPNYGCNFLYGMNYAWRHFGGDFGGVARWNVGGVSADPAPYKADLARMRAHGVRVARWWMFPDFRGESLRWDMGDVPAAVGDRTLADVAAALALAAEVDIDIMFTLFSFDGFRKNRDAEGVRIRGLAPHVRERSKRQALLELLVKPVARAAADSPHAKRLVGWDVMNEPEWALLPGAGIGGDPPFRTLANVDDPISHAEMVTFLDETIAVLHTETPRVPVSVGSAAAVWRNAWRSLDTDFHQFHMYEWVNAEWVEGIAGRPFAYDKPLRALGLDDKPVVMGEFALTGLKPLEGPHPAAGVPHEQLVKTWKALGYAGALSWSLTEDSLSAAEVQAGLQTASEVARTLGCR